MTNDIWREVLGEGLVVNLDLAVAPSNRPITAGDSAAHLLDAIAMLEEVPQANAKEEPPAPELQRLEVKIDLLTDLVSSLLADRIPGLVPASLSGSGLVVFTDLLTPECDRVEIYPCQWLAQPVVLELGPVVRHDDARGAAWRSPNPVLRDAIDRWVFRMHRREVARYRMRRDGMRADSI